VHTGDEWNRNLDTRQNCAVACLVSETVRKTSDLMSPGPIISDSCVVLHRPCIDMVPNGRSAPEGGLCQRAILARRSSSGENN